MNTREIVDKLWNLCNVLRDDGITYQQYVTELTYLLFIKMMKETKQEEKLPAAYRWDALEGKNDPDRLEHYRIMLVELGSKGNMQVREIYANATSCIRKPVTLSTLVWAIDEVDWYSAKEEGLGDLYEGLLEKNAGEKKSGAGQYFTPRVLINCMVSLMKPELGEVIQDPAAGTGGFLIAAHHWIKAHNDIFDLSADDYNRFRNSTFHGMELVQDTHRLAMMNLMLHDIESDGISTGIRLGDSLSSAGQALPRADIILTNPPFGTKKGGGLPTRDDFTYPTSNKQLAFLQHIYRGLKAGGRAAVVLPDNVLFESNTGADIRRDLMDKCDLHTILRLPTGIFYAQGVKTNVLFFNRGKTDKGNTKDVWVYDLRSNMKSFGKTSPLKLEHFAEFVGCYGKKSDGHSKRTDLGETGRFRVFSREWIRDKKQDSLDISWLRDDSVEDADSLPEPTELAKSAVLELQGAMLELQGILAELGEDLDE